MGFSFSGAAARGDVGESDRPGADAGGDGYKIVLRDLRQVYRIRGVDGEGPGDFLALESFSLNVAAGEFVSIVGPSGCGKSTLLNIVAGLARADGGQIFIDGKAVTGPALDRGIVMQGYALFPWRTVRKNVEFGLEMKGLAARERKEVSQRFIELVNLEGFEDRYPYELSGGMKQRVAIARALAYDPEVLLMDEPFAAVDAQTREMLQDELMRIWEKTGKTILFVTHGIDEAVILADRVVVMGANPGRIRAVIDIGLGRPRTNQEIRLSPAYGEIRQRVWESLQGAPGEGGPRLGLRVGGAKGGPLAREA
ncbi:MAG: ABC transporter ATP-binding protein [Deltaproteobacteria bacterium]|jgi:NitT/TauT family transport system ATP-binding protein|nr:ABC transporter ATP-binding protein [Deltaproteobacteria bacterium]